jgi:hypothetical protein
MQVTVTIENLSDDERAGLALRLAEAKAATPSGAPEQGCETMEQLYVLQITREIGVYEARAVEARIAAQRALGEVLVQLPQDIQAGLVQQLIEAAQAKGIDVSALEKPA